MKLSKLTVHSEAKNYKIKKKMLRSPMLQSVGELTNVAKAKYGNKKTYHCVVYHVEHVVGLLSKMQFYSSILDLYIV